MEYGSKYFLYFVLMSLTACLGSPDFPNEPTIEFISISKDHMDQGAFNSDSILIQIKFTDGDGDLGSSSDDNSPDITVIDNRTGLEEQFKIPQIQTGGTKFAISGDLTLKLFTTCCLFPDNIPPCSTPSKYPIDSISYELFITDEAGNESNHIHTQMIVLNCN